MEYENQEENLGEFEEFQEELITYETSQLFSTSIKAEAKSKIASKALNPKLSVLFERDPKFRHKKMQSLGDKICKTSPSNSKVFSINEAIFRCNFESANLESVKKTFPNTYEIRLRKEMNSDRVSSWFYFAVEGLKGEVKFILKGFSKCSSLYNNGMKICFREANECEWRRGGNKIFYMESCDDDEDNSQQYELHFTYFFKSNYPNSVQFAYSFPYTYSNLLQFISNHQNQLLFESLAKTYQGRDIPFLTIGNILSKRAVILTARVHPGETVGSFVMEGFIKELLSSSEFSEYLKADFCFYIVPMINPDGVVNGNYRFSGSGFDLNRKWKTCSIKMHPEIFFLKEKIKEIKKEKEITLFIDLHGHSRQKNVFFYGCPSQDPTNFKTKEFSYLMSKILPSFRYDYCSYSMSKDKEGTARITLWNLLKIDFIYTLETSFCGIEGQNFMIADYEKIGAKLCQGICLYFGAHIEKKTPSHFEIQLKSLLEKNMKEFYENKDIRNVEYCNNSSDSEPEAGEIPEGERGKVKNLIVFKKTSKPSSKIIEFSNKSLCDDEPIKSKTILNIKEDFRPKTIARLSNLEAFLPEKSRPHNFSIDLTPKSKSQLHVKVEFLNKAINEKLKSEEPRNEDNKQEKYHILLLNKTEEEKNKKKLVRFEGAQYRRIRKLAEEHNRRHVSAQHSTEVKSEEDETLMRGLLGMNNLFEIDRNNISQRSPSFFPNNSTSCRNRKGNYEKKYRKASKMSDVSLRSINEDVWCCGKQIF